MTATDPVAGFDAQSPPDPHLIDACVHCGFCLSTCPSYRVLGTEMDSPRGRIYLMDAIHEEQVQLADVVQHFDSCLGCLACVTTCPSGVEYDKLIAATRVQVQRHYQRPVGDRWLRQLIFQTLPYPQRLRALLWPLWLYQKLGLANLEKRLGLLKRLLPKSLAAMYQMLPPLSAKTFRDRWPEVVPAQGKQRGRVGVILGCVQRLFLPEVNEATISVLSANGFEVVLPPQQGCCGALPHHQGEEDQAQTLARQMINCFTAAHVDAVLINASGCGHTLKEYHRLLAADPEYRDRARDFVQKVEDVQVFLVKQGLVTPLHPLGDRPLALVYQDACHMIHGQKIRLEPRQLLRQIPQVQLREPLDAALCCGSAGVYNILQPDVAAELGRQKVRNLLNTRPDVIVSANVGCTVQFRQYLQEQSSSVPIYHPMQLLDLAIRGEQLPS
ncbi:heterodisulfide reductase-related iron-sulfur binding cluster [Thermosynechococcus sp. GLH187]|uniref:(Fe-S)-binding protein n=1 Tax=unclassified Thermosynechococcus TaxID=2622553 RepID=UPI0028773098|nr:MULTISPECIES: heterodisulfide reductase-related iron-sulfur binding cluster [unclassified Thermosynechococcus]WNC44528.1 heterodisulfide reductase-related iron-sulfur binding cluster [Thermosynechococcus sp. GLH187]WNC47064.1 heterodisulfide reductase-related iron-sulfur binding cluster [Thermosynechococcus sp. GLH333]WNC49601.1 heterodisulfide reductase-related iron-sulfur binding cluster [Thermosynechococcus sp. GLH87]